MIDTFVGSILDGLHEAVFVLNGDRRVIATNHVADTQFGKGVVGNDVVHIIRDPGFLNAIANVLSSKGRIEHTFSIDMPVSATFLLIATHLGVGNTDDAQVLLSLKDISDKREAQQMRTDFVANVSHELRSPLTAVTGFIETLRTSAKDDPEAREHFLNLMDQETQRMVRLIADLLSLSKVQSSSRVRPDGVVAIKPLLERVKTALSTRAEAEETSIDIQFLCDPPHIPGSDDQLTQVFQNLIENAVKYGRGGSKITITVKMMTSAPGIIGEAASICVEDQSDGIPQEHIFRLTERFYRVDAHRSRNKGGTGLGLAIVKHIITRHRGRLIINSEMGVGSSFNVLLPINRAKPVT